MTTPVKCYAATAGSLMCALDGLLPPADAVAAASHPDPYGYYQRLCEQAPLFFDRRLNLWVASSHAAVTEAFELPALRVRPPAEPVPRALLGGPAGDVFANLVRMNDGAFHAAHKPRLEQSARRWTLARVAHASSEATRALQRVLSVNDFLTVLPAQVVARLLDVPAPQLRHTTQWTHDFSAGIAAGASLDAMARAHAAAAGLLARGVALGLDVVEAANFRAHGRVPAPAQCSCSRVYPFIEKRVVAMKTIHPEPAVSRQAIQLAALEL